MRVTVVAIVEKDYRTHYGQSIREMTFTRAKSETTARVAAAKKWKRTEGAYPVMWLRSEVAGAKKGAK
jgi:hypothetical protein